MAHLYPNAKRNGQTARFLPAVYVLVAFACCRADNIQLDFDHDVAGSPPQGVFSSGITSPASYVRVEHHDQRQPGDLSVVFRWSTDAAVPPRLTVGSKETPFPDIGSLSFDFVVDKHGGPFHIVGESAQGKELFHILANRMGQLAVRTENGDSPFADFIIGQWYLVRLTYNVDEGVYAVILDNYFTSGDVETTKLGKDDAFARIVCYGEEGGPSSYGLDTISLVSRQQAPSPGGQTDLPLGTLARRIERHTVLAPEDKYRRAIIVYPSGMNGGAAAALELRDRIQAKTGRTLACLSDQVVIDTSTWLVRDKYLGRPMIVLGNAVDNKVLYAVATKFLAMSNRSWPGGDKFCNRSILEPFRSDVNLILLEASTIEGLRAAVASFGRRLNGLSDTDLSVPYFRALGAAAGEWKEKTFARSGLDLSRPIADIKEQIIQKHGKTAPIRGGGLYFYPIWEWLSGSSIEAAKYAAAVLMLQQDRFGDEQLGGHYNFDRTFKAWQLCMTSGVLDDDQINWIESIMAKAAADPRDYYAYGFRSHNGKRICRGANRHTHSSLSNYACCSDYVLTHCRLNGITRKAVESFDDAYRRIAKRFTDSFRDNNDTSEVGDSTVAMINLMALTGNMDYVRNGTLADSVLALVCQLNNLGYYTAQSPYIGNGLMNVPPGRSVLAAAAFYLRDPQFQWLARNLRLAACRTSHENPVYVDDVPEEYPTRFLGLSVVPFDKRIYRTFETPDYLAWGEPLCEPSGIPYEQLFDCAVFRDGFEPDTAFLLLMSTQLTNGHALNHSNAIIQYTDLGKILLYTSSCLVEKWARNVVAISNGRPSRATFGCVKKAAVNSDRVSAISSVNPLSGNSEWTRTMVHRRGHFFVVIDQMKALVDDEFSFSARWRTYYPQTLEPSGVCRVEAGDGVQMRIIGAGQNIVHDSRRAKADGSTRPFMYVQRKSATLQKGQAAAFKNVFYASSPARPDTCEVREVDANSVMVKGVGKNWTELAVIGVGTTSEALSALRVEADIYYINRAEIVAANCRRIESGNEVLFSSADGENVTLPLEGRDLALDQLFSSLAASTIAHGAGTPEDQGLKELWTFDDFALADQRLTIKSVTSNRPPISAEVESLNDDKIALQVSKIRHGVRWQSDAEKTLEVVVDMGEVVDIQDIRLFSAVADGYYRRFYYQPGDMTFSVFYSNDAFNRDVREASPTVEYTDYTYPRAHYTYAGRIPLFVIPANCRARYVKIVPTTSKEYIGFQKIKVYGTGKDPELTCTLRNADLDGDGEEELVVLTSNSELAVLSGDGTKVWSRQFRGTVTAWNIVDMETDGKQEVLIYTTDEKFYLLACDGTERLVVDMEMESRKLEPEKWDRWYNIYCFKHVNAWDPDGDGIKEIFGFGHTNQTVITLDGTVAAGKSTGQYKPEQTLADSSVLGRNVLTGMSYDFRVMDEQYKIQTSIAMPAKSSGNNQMPGLARVFAVKRPDLAGFLAVNPVSLLWRTAPDLKEGWSEFMNVPITCCALLDIDQDGGDDLVLGCKDGFIRVYGIATGQVIRKALTGLKPVKGLAALDRGRLAVLTPDALQVLDSSLERTAALRTAADVLATVKVGGRSLVTVATDRGSVHAYAADRNAAH
jgi:hypothetical protein